MKNNDSLMNINDMLSRMEATLQNVDSAREQVENTVDASNALMNVVAGYADSVKSIYSELQKWEKDLQQMQSADKKAAQESVTLMRSSCQDIIGNVRTSLSTEMDKFAAMNAEMDNLLKTAKASITQQDSVLKNIDSSIHNLDNSLIPIQTSLGAVKTSLESADISVNELKASLASIASSLVSVRASLDSIMMSLKIAGASIDTVKLSLDSVKISLEKYNNSVKTIENNMATGNHQILFILKKYVIFSTLIICSAIIFFAFIR